MKTAYDLVWIAGERTPDHLALAIAVSGVHPPSPTSGKELSPIHRRETWNALRSYAKRVEYHSI